MRKISVVICAYTEDRWDELVSAVTSVRDQTIPAHEIVVVVDYNPALFEHVRTAIPDVVAVQNHEPRGLAGARNSGLMATSGEVIAFMDEDALAAPDWLEQLNGGYDKPDILGVGGAIEPNWLSGRPRWFPEEYDWVVGCTYLGMPQIFAPVRNLIGCNMSFRREVFNLVGGFINGIGRIGTRPVGCEETEFCIRAAQSQPQGRFLYIPSARVHHRVPAKRARFDYFRARCYSEGLSKALIARLVGAKQSLASERTYTFRVLPLGVIRGVLDLPLRRDPTGLLRAGAIIAGLAFAAFGYLRGRLAGVSLPSQQPENIAPATVGYDVIE